jgi:hypothetical protein
MEEDEKGWKSVIVSACVRGCACVCVCEVERGGVRGGGEGGYPRDGSLATVRATILRASGWPAGVELVC